MEKIMITANDLSVHRNHKGEYTIYYAGMRYGSVEGNKIRLSNEDEDIEEYESNICKKIMDKLSKIDSKETYNKLSNENGFLKLKNI